MKKFGKFLFTTLSVAAVIGGAYYFVKNILNKDSVDAFDDFDDDFDDFDSEGQKDGKASKDDRGYVTLDLEEETKSEKEETPEENASSDASEDAAPKE